LPFVHDIITTFVQNVFLQPEYTDLNAANLILVLNDFKCCCNSSN